MTRKIYYEDSYRRTCNTHIVQQHKDEIGLYVVLEETIFYPTGGGQPHDTGTMNGVVVTQVEREDGEIRHYIETALPEGEVTLELDWNRRFDHMQQHAGQHILSAAFAESLGYETVSFHLGTDFLTIDLKTPSLTPEEALQAEDLANKIIQDARPIETKWVSREELINYPLRKHISVEEDIRLVIIPEFDYNACGGTHPRLTSEVGTIKVFDWEKHRGNVRLHFVCGDRVRQQLQGKHEAIRNLTSTLQSPEGKLVEAAEKLLHNQKDQEKEIESLKEQLLSFELKDLVANAATKESYAYIKGAFTHRPIKELQTLAQNITEDHNQMVVVLTVQNDEKLQLVMAKGSEPAVDIRSVAKLAFHLINGKGGGKEYLVQGGGEAVMTPTEFLIQIEELLD
ncbi:alanyl-tRNA editing protein [Bacillus coahuilensis]|uniref:alanyl-tRNA editing protein n=1 Tax=Bacillus coahuilensis TaxID=408580 RepID=UPI00018506FC|nr:DHHA1 domain-containing protein [Bacillus coahuilensis]